MTGKTHKAIGVATGVALVIYSIRTSNMMYALGLATAPFGAMLPDIDHDRSKLGAVRKRVTEVIHVAAIIVLVLSVLFGVVYTILKHNCQVANGGAKLIGTRLLDCTYFTPNALHDYLKTFDKTQVYKLPDMLHYPGNKTLVYNIVILVSMIFPETVIDGSGCFE